MVSALEGAAAKQGIAAALDVGVENISGNDSVLFTKYLRLVLPLDGYVFWVRADLVQASALFNILGFNNTLFNQTPQAFSPLTFSAKGSFHYATTQHQNESETEGINAVTFTALEPVQQFNDVQSSELWIGQYAGDNENYDKAITFAFNSRGKYYGAADLFHYSGIAVLPIMKTQLITSPDQLYNRTLIVSNSLPIWLSLPFYKPPYPGFSSSIPLYPSKLVPDNLAPPYGAVHIEPSGTEALQAAPYLGKTLSHYQLCRDVGRIVFYGLNNADVLNFIDTLNQFSYDYSYIGLGNIPIPRDEKRNQSELNVIAQMKSIEFNVTYHQYTARDLSRQLIEKCIVGYNPTELIVQT